MERKATPRLLMKPSIHLHVAGLSLSDTVPIIDRFGVGCCRTTVHNWVRKANLQLEDGKSPNHVALDEAVIQLNNERFWLLAAVDPETNEFLHARLHPACAIALTERFLRELREKHDVRKNGVLAQPIRTPLASEDVADTLFLVAGAPWHQAALHHYNLRVQHVIPGNRNSVERVFKEIKRRTNQFVNQFRNASAESAESWLQTLVFAWNQLI